MISNSSDTIDATVGLQVSAQLGIIPKYHYHIRQFATHRPNNDQLRGGQSQKFLDSGRKAQEKAVIRRI